MGVLCMTTVSDDEARVLRFRGMGRNFSLPLFPDSFWLGIIVSNRVPSIGQIELLQHLLNLKLFNCVQIELLVLDTWKYIIVCKQISFGLFKSILPTKLFVYKSYLFNKKCVSRIWHEITHKGLYAIKFN